MIVLRGSVGRSAGQILIAEDILYSAASLSVFCSFVKKSIMTFLPDSKLVAKYPDCNLLYGEAEMVLDNPNSLQTFSATSLRPAGTACTVLVPYYFGAGEASSPLWAAPLLLPAPQ